MMAHSTQDVASYEWSARDKLVYFLALIPFLAAFFGTAYLLATKSIYLTVGLVILYLLANVFQAACCIGCPYRGRYCPALYGVYLGNLLSTWLYADREHDDRFFKTNATLGELSILAILVYSAGWLATLSWWYVLIVVLLAAVHMVLFLTLLCPKCGYNETCPAGQSACRVFKRRASG
jgi:hypothetical protein